MLDGVNNQRMNWLQNVKSLLLSISYGDVWSNHVQNTSMFLENIKLRLTDLFIQKRDNFLNNSSKYNLYKYLLDTFCLQYYLE